MPRKAPKTTTMWFSYNVDSRTSFDNRGDGVIEILTRRFTDDAIELNTADDLPDVLPHGVLWEELNMLIYPNRPTTPMFKVWITPQRTRFDKKDTLFYIQAFFGKHKGPLYLHVWKDRVNAEKAERSRKIGMGVHTGSAWSY